jgi:intermediate peptidase
MEHFAVDESVLRLFARHWETDAPLPYEIVQDFVATERAGAAADTESQIILATLDQRLHSEASSEAAFDSTRETHAVLAQRSSVLEPDGTRPHGFFGHLVGYGGSYYAYLFDRAIAGRVWEQVFHGGKDGGGIQRESGERFKREVLSWGGSRDPWACVGGVLREEGLADGGEAAMAEVGKWGVMY